MNLIGKYKEPSLKLEPIQITKTKEYKEEIKQLLFFEQRVLENPSTLTEEELMTCMQVRNYLGFTKNERPRMCDKIQERWGM